MLEETEIVELTNLQKGLKKIGSIENYASKEDIYFEEKHIGDSSRPHPTLASLIKQKAIVPRRSNLAYTFNDIIGLKKYKEISYMPKLMVLARQEITRVLQTELKRKEQIKSAIVVKCIYYKQEKVDKVLCIRITEKYHKEKIEPFSQRTI